MNLNTIRYIDNNLTFTRMGFGLEKFGFGKKNAEEQPAVIENPAETEPSATTTETEPDYSRRNFVIGGIAAVAGSTLLGEDAEAARYRVPNYTTDRRDTIIERNIQSEARRNRQPDPNPDQRFGSSRYENRPRVESYGAMTYIGFSPTEHEQKIIVSHLFRRVPEAISAQINLQSSREGVQNLEINILKSDNTTLVVTGRSVYLQPGINKNTDLVNNLLERL